MKWMVGLGVLAVFVGIFVVNGLRSTTACVLAPSPTQSDIPESWLAHHPDGGTETVYALSPGVPDNTWPEFVTGALPIRFDHYAPAHRIVRTQEYCGPITQMPAGG